MFKDLNHRLASAAEQMARLAKAQRHLAALETEHETAAADVSRLKAQAVQEERDVERLEGVSLTGLFYAVLGSKEEQLQKERQEALAVQLKYEEARRRLAGLEADLVQARHATADLPSAQAEYASLLQEKEALISSSAGADDLFRYAEREQQLKWQEQQLLEARSAGQTADAALTQVLDSLESARGWGTWDMLGGGMIATAIKHSRVDDARGAAHQAQQALAAFRRELQDVSAEVHVAQIDLDGFTRFADFFFDGLITDWIVQNRINHSLASARQSRDQVSRLLSTLTARLEQTRAELAAVVRERADFIARFNG